MLNKENNMSDFEKKRDRATSAYNQRPSFAKKKMIDELSRMKYVPSTSNHSGVRVSNIDYASEEDETRVIDEELVPNDEDKLSIPTTVKVKQTRLTVNLQEKLDEEICESYFNFWEI